MSIKKFKKATEPKLEAQTLFQLTQMKSFVDASLKNCISQNFENDSQKIQYLLGVLYDIRDFVLSQTTENSLRINLLNQFNEIENQTKLGNDPLNLAKELSKKTEEKLEQNPKELETNEEEEVESTTDS
tara:strand:+ start:458 stop:844 length:387 start_codon:yes stop_codon:yes gene_type:complete